MQHKKIIALTECAVMIAAATVLSLVKIWNMPLGGSVTLLSMLPICLVAIKHGSAWGLASSFVYSIIQLIFGITMDGLLGWGLTPTSLIACIFVDYIFAFTVLGLAGLLRGHGRVGMCAGIAIAIALRFVCHLISGTLIFASWTPESFGTNYLLYSVCYNGAYMLPEMVFTMAATMVISKIPVVQRLVGIYEK